MRRKRRYRNHKSDRTDRSPILALFTWVLFLCFYWVATILWVVWITIFLFAWIHILNKYFWRYEKKKFISVISYILWIGIVVWWVYLLITNVKPIHEKYKEISDWTATFTSLWQNKKGWLELQPNKQWILLKLLNNIFQNIWQAQ